MGSRVRMLLLLISLLAKFYPSEGIGTRMTVRKRNERISFIINICRDWGSTVRGLFISLAVSPSLLLQYFVSSLMLVHCQIYLLALKLGVSVLKATTPLLCRVSSGTWMYRVGLSGIRLRSYLTKNRRVFSTRYWEILSKREDGLAQLRTFK